LELGTDAVLPARRHPGAPELDGLVEIAEWPIPGPSAEPVACLEHEHGMPGVVQVSRGGHPAEPASDHYCLVVHGFTSRFDFSALTRAPPGPARAARTSGPCPSRCAAARRARSRRSAP